MLAMSWGCMSWGGILWWLACSSRNCWRQWGFIREAGGTMSWHDVIKWKHFLRYWPFVQGIHWSPVNSPHKGQWCRALMFPFICAWINGWVNNGEAGDLRCHHTHYDIIVMYCISYHWRLSLELFNGYFLSDEIKKTLFPVILPYVNLQL